MTASSFRCTTDWHLSYPKWRQRLELDGPFNRAETEFHAFAIIGYATYPTETQPTAPACEACPVFREYPMLREYPMPPFENYPQISMWMIFQP
jgi:hypothetical protein